MATFTDWYHYATTGFNLMKVYGGTTLFVMRVCFDGPTGEKSTTALATLHVILLTYVYRFVDHRGHPLANSVSDQLTRFLRHAGRETWVANRFCTSVGLADIALKLDYFRVAGESCQSVSQLEVLKLDYFRTAGEPVMRL